MVSQPLPILFRIFCKRAKKFSISNCISTIHAYIDNELYKSFKCSFISNHHSFLKDRCTLRILNLFLNLKTFQYQQPLTFPLEELDVVGVYHEWIGSSLIHHYQHIYALSSYSLRWICCCDFVQGQFFFYFSLLIFHLLSNSCSLSALACSR